MSNIRSLLAEIENHLGEVKSETNNPKSSEALRRARAKTREAVRSLPKDDD